MIGSGERQESSEPSTIGTSSSWQMRIKNGWDIRITRYVPQDALPFSCRGAARPAPRFYTISLWRP